MLPDFWYFHGVFSSGFELAELDELLLDELLALLELPEFPVPGFGLVDVLLPVPLGREDG